VKFVESNPSAPATKGNTAFPTMKNKQNQTTMTETVVFNPQGASQIALPSLGSLRNLSNHVVPDVDGSLGSLSTSPYPPLATARVRNVLDAKGDDTLLHPPERSNARETPSNARFGRNGVIRFLELVDDNGDASERVQAKDRARDALIVTLHVTDFADSSSCARGEIFDGFGEPRCEALTPRSSAFASEKFVTVVCQSIYEIFSFPSR
jgi:hypothetical protein